VDGVGREPEFAVDIIKNKTEWLLVFSTSQLQIVIHGRIVLADCGIFPEMNVPAIKAYKK